MAEEVEVILKGQFENGKLIIDQTGKIEKNLNAMDGAAKKTDKSTSSLFRSLKRIATIVGIGFLINQFKKLTFGALKAAGTLEQVDIALTTMIGSAEKAAKLQKDLIDFAKKTPFQIEGIFQTTKQLLAYGVAQEDIIDTMSTLGNIAAGVSVPIERLALVFGQVRSTGRLLGQDLNQFTQAGVPLLAELAKVLGKTEAEVLKLKESGQISFDLVKTALENMTSEGGRFFNLMENQSKTLLGTISNLEDAFFQVKVAIGEALLPVAKKVVNSMIIFFEDLTIKIQANQKAIAQFAKDFVAAAKAIIDLGIKPLIKIIGFFIEGIQTILNQPLLKWLSLATTAVIALRIAFFALAANPIILAITGIVIALGFLVKEFESFPSIIQIALLKAARFFKQFQVDVNVILEALFDKLSFFSNVPGFGWIDDAKDQFGSLKDSISADVGEINRKIKEIEEGFASTEKQAEISITSDVQSTTPEVEEFKQMQFVSIEEDPAKTEKSRLKALKEENSQLLEAQKDFLAGFITNQSEADQILDDNKTLKLQQDLLKEGEFAARKAELDQLVLDDKITLDEFEFELEQVNNDAKLEALQTQFDAEFAKEEVNNARLVQLKVQLEKARELASEKRNKVEVILENKHVKNAGIAANELVALQNSKNKELAAIGKAAALFQITTDTARGAIAAFSALSGIPIIGPALGAAAAAAVIAFGLERSAEVAGLSFAVGTPNIPQDQLANVHKGEMIIPASFSSAIRSGDLALSGQDFGGQQGSSSGVVINVVFDDAKFFGTFEDEDIESFTIRMSEMINEDLLPIIPTRTV